MNYRRFGKTDLLVSEIGFGAWAIGGAAQAGNVQIGWGQTDDHVSENALHEAFEHGINFYDTADFYGLGHSEALLGNVFGNNDQVLIATKVGQKPGQEKPVEIDYSKAYLLQACEASLKRLKRGCIDYYQLHVANINHLAQGECIEALHLLKEQGKIRYWGISLSTYNPFPEAEFMLQHELGDGFQLVFNIINQKAFPLIKRMYEKGYGIIARMPLQFGLLAGKFNSNTHFDETDHRSIRLTPEIIEKANQLLEALWPIAENHSIPKSSLALSFILSSPEVSVAIPGIRNPGQVNANTSFIIRLSQQEQDLIRQLYDSQFSSLLSLMQLQG